jgi:asparagine synthase (glutamine-hydrolysing)
MCGIAGYVHLKGGRVPRGQAILSHMAAILAHRGPDGEGTWIAPDGEAGFAHRRLAIIDPGPSAAQPMQGRNGSVLVFNGEIYNYPDLRRRFEGGWTFASASDTETILAGHAEKGARILDDLRGMFAFALWDPRRRQLFCARDRFGIKPFYYAVVDEVFLFASEAKALLPFLPEIATNYEALGEYLTFQYALGEKTLFAGIKQLLPGHALSIEDGAVRIWRYWDVRYAVDAHHRPAYYRDGVRRRLEDSVALHLRSDVPVGTYLSGGFDSTVMTMLARDKAGAPAQAFHGRFADMPGYDESPFARAAAAAAGATLHVADIGPMDFADQIGAVIRHLDYPVAGPGAFAQFMVSRLAARHVKTVLGGQGGDELFAGYARYLLAYFEQCFKAAIDGTAKGRYVVTAESIIPNMGALREYKPMMQDFWRDGMFGPMDERYFRLIDRSVDMQDDIDWQIVDTAQVAGQFKALFDNPANVAKDAYLDKMMHFDFKCQLPALLHVEDRMSMAWGLESRVPFLDHPLVEFLATVPAIVKFKGGELKRLLKESCGDVLPPEVLMRRDKMGFPVPLKEWFDGPLSGFIRDVLGSQRAGDRPYIKRKGLQRGLSVGTRFSRRLWGLLSLELWQVEFHDRAAEIRRDFKV